MRIVCCHWAFGALQQKQKLKEKNRRIASMKDDNIMNDTVRADYHANLLTCSHQEEGATWSVVEPQVFPWGGHRIRSSLA